MPTGGFPAKHRIKVPIKRTCNNWPLPLAFYQLAKQQYIIGHTAI